MATPAHSQKPASKVNNEPTKRKLDGGFDPMGGVADSMGGPTGAKSQKMDDGSSSAGGHLAALLEQDSPFKQNSFTSDGSGLGGGDSSSGDLSDQFGGPTKQQLPPLGASPLMGGPAMGGGMGGTNSMAPMGSNHIVGGQGPPMGPNGGNNSLSGGGGGGGGGQGILKSVLMQDPNPSPASSRGPGAQAGQLPPVGARPIGGGFTGPMGGQGGPEGGMSQAQAQQMKAQQFRAQFAQFREIQNDPTLSKEMRQEKEKAFLQQDPQFNQIFQQLVQQKSRKRLASQAEAEQRASGGNSRSYLELQLLVLPFSKLALL